MDALSGKKMNQMELWWWDMPSLARWLVGSISLATMAGVLGGVLV